MLKSIVFSSGRVAEHGFLKALGANLAKLLTRGGSDQRIVCLSLIWDIGSSPEQEGIILSIIPDPMILTASVISAEKLEIGVAVMEESLCALATRR